MSGVGAATLAVLFCLGAVLLLCVLFVAGVVAIVRLVRFFARETDRRPQRSRAARAPAAPPPSELEEQAVRRYRQLLELGLDPVTAVGAALAEVDVSALQELLARRCPPELALRILESGD